MPQLTIKSVLITLIVSCAIVAAIVGVWNPHRSSPPAAVVEPTEPPLPVPLLPDEQFVKTELAALATTTTLTWDQARELLSECGVVKSYDPNGRDIVLANDHGLTIEDSEGYAAITDLVLSANKDCAQKIYVRSTPVNIPATTTPIDASTQTLLDLATSTKLTWNQVKQLLDACQVIMLYPSGIYQLRNGEMSSFASAVSNNEAKLAVDEAGEKCGFIPQVIRHTGGDQ